MGNYYYIGASAGLALLALWSLPGRSEQAAKGQEPSGPKSRAASAKGPLRVHPRNPRYFTDGTGRAVYLTGSHTWSNLIDRGPSDPPPVFDFHEYLDFLGKHQHNFIRLWGRHVTWYHGYGEQELHAAPLAWKRTGPGSALDGKPRFDLTKLNQGYFDRLRARVSAARDRGIYVSVMLFGGSYECRGGWRGNPFHPKNNINGINGDPGGDGEGLETQTLQVGAITRLQEAYVRKVVDSVNDLDNVLYEISNESDDSSKDWQYHLIRFIHDYEARHPRQHPVGMTALWGGVKSNPILSASPAEWISPQTDGRALPAADGGKVSILDSDHWFVVDLYKNPAFGREWVWKSFCGGHNPILMEHLPPLSVVLNDHPLTPHDPGYVASRTAMGQTRRFAERLDLASMTPTPDLASTGSCLAHPGHEYLVYQPEPGEAFWVELRAGTYRCEWFDPQRGVTAKRGTLTAVAGRLRFQAPFDGDAILHLKAASTSPGPGSG
jgi:uncharacterized protein DUF6298